MPHRFLADRSETTLYNDKHSYLRHFTDDFKSPRLCHVLMDIGKPLKWNSSKRGYPWITPVLGSGCLETREESRGMSVDALPEAVNAALGALSAQSDLEIQLPVNDSVATIGRHFVESLITDRLGDVEDRPIDAQAPDLPEWKLRLVLLTALLTHVYHRLKALEFGALSRQGADRVNLSDDEEDWDPWTREILLEVRRQLRALLRLTKGMPDLRQLHDILGHLQTHLQEGDQPRHISLIDIQVLTETTWFYLTEDLAIYPGWSDLLVNLSLDKNAPNIIDGHPRPTFPQIDTPAARIRMLFEEVTRRSIEASGDDASSDRDQFYRVVAEILRRQADLREAKLTSRLRPPPASAFVTTFDLELELALARDHRPFVVAFPVNYIAREQKGGKDVRMAAALWLGCVVRPDPNLPALDCIQEPRDWFLFGPDLDAPRGDGPTLGALPIVVRLSGCPLVNLPKLYESGSTMSTLGQEISQRARGGMFARLRTEDDEVEDHPRLVHATLLDEYNAVRQSIPEFFTYQTPNNDPTESCGVGLPTELTDGSNAAFVRYWMLMGVQVGDPPVRYRLASQLVAPTLTTGNPNTVVRPTRAGVAINRRPLEPSTRNLLYWYGFDLVEARCEEFTTELHHYLRHLDGDPSEGWPSIGSSEGCKLQ